MSTEKSRGRKIFRQELSVPEKGDGRSERQYKKMVRQYRSAMEAYRLLAAELHKDLLKSKDFLKREK